MKLSKDWEIIKRFRWDYSPEEQTEKGVRFTWKTEVKSTKTNETKIVDGKVKIEGDSKVEKVKVKESEVTDETLD